jgi:hypothetical protein
MIYTDLKYQDKTLLDYQYTLNLKNEGQERQIDVFWGRYLWEGVGIRKG